MKGPSYRSSGKRPPFSVSTASGSYSRDEFDSLWARREEVCLRYRKALSGANVDLSEASIIWLNFLEHVAASTFPWISSGFILAPDLEKVIDEEHLSRVGNYFRPVTSDELKADGAELTAAGIWAAETLHDSKWSQRFAKFVEDVDRGNEARVKALALRCWPKETTLVPASARWFYKEEVGDIPFESFADHLRQTERRALNTTHERPRYGGLEVAAFLHRWFGHHSYELDGGGWHIGNFRRELKRERQRFRI